MDALHDAVDRADVIGLFLVVAETQKAPSVLAVLVAFHDAVVEGLAEGFELFPFGRLHVHGGVGAVVVGAIVDGQVEARGGVVVFVGAGDAVGFVFRVRVDFRPGQRQGEVDAIFVLALPFEDVFVGAEFVGGVAAGEDEAVVAVGEGG